MLTQPAFADGATATLQGHVNAGHAGTKVVATDSNTGEKITATVGADGSYVLVGLRPGTYQVKAGEGTSQEVSLPVGVTVTVDLDAAGSSVTVVGRRKNVRTSETATSVSQRQIENLPQNDRNFLNFAALAPGVTVSTDPFRKTFQAGSQHADQVNIFIDGQSYKSQIQQGGIAGQDSSQGNPFPQLAVQEFKVSTQNFKAEQEFASSAVITAITKTGGTDFHGTVFSQYQDKGMLGVPFFERGNPHPAYHRYQYGADIGGPIVKNVLHFYAAFEGMDQLNPGTSVNITGVPGAPTNLNGAFERKFEQKLYFGKLTWFASNEDTVDFTVLDRHEARLDDFGGNRPFTSARDVDNVVKNDALIWKHRGNGYLAETSLAYQTYRWFPKLHAGADRVIDVTAGIGGGDLLISSQSFDQFSRQATKTFKEDITFTGLEMNGSHVVKIGLKVADNTYDRVEGDVRPTYFYSATAPGFSYGSAANTPYKANVALAPNLDIKAQNTQIGLYAQDDWTVDEHLAYSLGLRWDYETNMMDNKFVTPAPIAAALRANTGFIAAGFNPNDYISTGSSLRKFTGAIQPRLGFSYDVAGDRDLVLFGAWGRYYDRNLFIKAQSARRGTINQTAQLSFCGTTGGLPACAAANPLRPGFDTNGNTAWLASYNTPENLRLAALSLAQGGSQHFINNNYKVPYSDQFQIGLRKRFGDVQTSLTYANIKSYDGFEFVRGNRYPNGTFTPLGNGFIFDNHPFGLTNGTTNYGRFEISSNGRKSQYDAIYVQVDKPYTTASKYGYTTTLTLTDTKAIGNPDDSGDNFAAASSDAYGYVDAAGVDHIRFVGTGIVSGPWGTTLSATLTLASGQGFGTVDATGNIPAGACCRANFNGVYFPKDQLAFQQLDLRFAKDFELPSGQVITIDGQVYNVFDHVNRSYSAWGAGANWGGGPSLKENNTAGPPRSYQIGLKYKW